MWVVIVALASCQDVAEQTAELETVAVESGYPSLHTVPPRPQLSYPVEQRRAIVDGLIADHENARYTSEVIRYRTGLSSLPPPAPRTLAAIPLDVGPQAGDAAAAAPAITSAPPGDETATEVVREEDSLRSFMQDMLDAAEPPGEAPTGPSREPEARAAPLEDHPEPSEPAPDADPTTASSDRLRGSTPPPAPVKPATASVTEMAGATAREGPRIEAAGTDRVAPEADASRPAPGTAQIDVANGLVAIEAGGVDDRSMALESIAFAPGEAIAFAPGSAALPPDAQARLVQILDAVNAQGARVKIVGEAEAPDLALDRARAIGLALVQSGLPADRLEMSLARGGTADRARLFLASPAAP
jgi:outer membrane protein OmpA-like peptidoglycan-associated protein